MPVELYLKLYKMQIWQKNCTFNLLLKRQPSFRWQNEMAKTRRRLFVVEYGRAHAAAAVAADSNEI